MMFKKTICVDLDGVLADYSTGWQGIYHIGEPIAGAKEFTQDLAKLGKVVVFTTRCKVDVQGRDGETAEDLKRLVETWLKKHEIYYDYVYTQQGKPLAAVYIDDRAISCQPQNNQYAYFAAIRQAEILCESAADVKCILSGSICGYCSLPIYPPVSYHEKGDCQITFKYIGAEVLKLIKIARDIYKETQPHDNGWDMQDSKKLYGELAAILSQLKALGFPVEDLQ